MPILDFIFLAIALALLIPSMTLWLECSAALMPKRAKQDKARVLRPSVAVLIPAHNEAAGIKVILENLLPQLTALDRLLVIADNCSDDTAAISDASGATVIERQDLERRGKGYALDYGLQFLSEDPPSVVVVVDADCLVHHGSIDRITRLAVAKMRPVQATYLMEKPAGSFTPKDSVSALAFRVKNLVRPTGLARLGLPCLLAGTGMAFPWSVIRQVSLESGHIVEDMQLSLEVACLGRGTLFCSDASVTGRLPQQEQASKSQRTRWEHGHLQTLLTQVPTLLKASVRQRHFDLLAVALDISVPPLSLLVMVWIAATAGAILAAALGSSWIPTILLAITGLLILTSIMGAWAKFCRDEIPAQTLLAVPLYILWKIPLYLAFLVRPQKKWIRTERDTVELDRS
ncbi:MAG: glycosyl transferase [Cyanobacteria bacterium QH_8_48_120]|nr:MAG: glycosyl transferase [Cyanobacteria bacterium QH_1_48_107]PSO62163.1 MAG: glycosyl transferase [Cyanobacteria bacterium QH_6_48_35]PSO72338.1 MAG: glycosyl transferase [Cyanobacteria bacterium QH_8_48_120]